MMTTNDCNMCKGTGKIDRLILETPTRTVILNPISLEAFLKENPDFKITSKMKVSCYFCKGIGKVDWVTNITNNPHPQDLAKRYFEVTKGTTPMTKDI